MNHSTLLKKTHKHFNQQFIPTFYFNETKNISWYKNLRGEEKLNDSAQSGIIWYSERRELFKHGVHNAYESIKNQENSMWTETHGE